MILFDTSPAFKIKINLYNDDKNRCYLFFPPSIKIMNIDYQTC